MNFVKDKRIFAKIKKNDDDYYQVTIKTVYETSIGKIPVSRKIPFLFRGLEMAKDFITVLPNKIEKYTAKSKSRCGDALFKNKYHTYKLYVDDLEIYVVWTWTSNDTVLFDNSYNYSTENHLVCSFTNSLKIDKYGNLDYGSTRETYLSDVVKYMKEHKNDKVMEDPDTYIFELVKQ